MKISCIQLLLLISSLFLVSCSGIRQGIVTFNEPKPEIFTKPSLKTYLKQNPTPKIVLRVPDASSNAASQDSYSTSDVYNAIEKELLKAGFDVRDRGLFNEILKKSQTSDYSSIGEQTDTELILELVKLDVGTTYKTNKFRGLKNNKEYTLRAGVIELTGAATEFRVVLVDGNEIAGTYEFSYAPCPNGCKYNVAPSGRLYALGQGGGRPAEVKEFEVVSSDILTEFMSESTRQLISELKK